MKVENVMIVGRGKSVKGLKFIAECKMDIVKLGEIRGGLIKTKIVHEISWGDETSESLDECFITLNQDDLISFLCGYIEEE